MKVYCYPSPGGPIPVSLFLHAQTDAERALLKYIADAYVTTGFGCKPDGAMDHVAVMLTPKESVAVKINADAHSLKGSEQ